MITASASSIDLTPPDALTPISGPTVSLINLISSGVAPPVENPVDVLTKSAPAFLANSQALTFSSSVKRQVSIITFVSAFLSAASTTAFISFSTYS